MLFVQRCVSQSKEVVQVKKKKESKSNRLAKFLKRFYMGKKVEWVATICGRGGGTMKECEEKGRSIGTNQGGEPVNSLTI